MTSGRTGVGAASRPAGFSPGSDPSIASALVLPRLAAIGPTLDLDSINSPYYSDGPGRLSGLARAGQVTLATALGLAMLLVPMSVLAYAAKEAYAVVVAEQTHGVGKAPTWVPPGSSLDPADKPSP